MTVADRSGGDKALALGVALELTVNVTRRPTVRRG